jgi:hypothetical protein
MSSATANPNRSSNIFGAIGPPSSSSSAFGTSKAGTGGGSGYVGPVIISNTYSGPVYGGAGGKSYGKKRGEWICLD